MTLFLCFFLFGQLATWSAAREQVQHAVAGSIANEVLNAVRTVAAFNGEPHAISRYCYYKSESGNKRVERYMIYLCEICDSQRGDRVLIPGWAGRQPEVFTCQL